MTGLLQTPLRFLANALLKSVPNNWFLRGDDDGGSGAEGTGIGDPYKESSWVRAALDLITQPIAGADLKFHDEKGASIEDPRLADWWRMPARNAHERMGMEMLVAYTVAVRGIFGGVYWILDESWLNRSASLYNPIVLAIRSQLTPVWEGRQLSGWAYRGANGSVMSLMAEQVFSLRLPNPKDPDSLDGVAPWTSIQPSAESAMAAAKFAKRTMDQNGDRGAILIARQGLTPEQREMLKAELREKRRAAARGEYRDSVMGGDIEVQTPSLSAISTDFVRQIQASKEEIFVAYGVPASMASAVASYSVGAASDWYRLIAGACAAESKAIAGPVSRISDYLLGWRSLAADIAGTGQGGRERTRRCTAVFDFSGHPVMAEVKAERVKTLEALFKMGTPVKTANEWLGLGIPEFPGWEKGYLPFSLAPVGETEEGGGQKSDAGKSGPDLVDLVRTWGHRRSGIVTQRQSAERAALWAKIDRARTADRKRIQKAVTKHLMQARSETLRNLKANAENLAKRDGGEIVGKAGAIDLVFDLINWSRGFVGTIKSILGDIFVGAGNAVDDEVPGDFDPMTEADPAVIAHLADRENKMKDVSDEVHQEVIATLEEGIAAGETLDELSARVRTIFNEISKAKAEVIARTETGAAYETARYHAMMRAGVSKKAWLSGGDDGVTRPTHMAADGQVRLINEPFVVGEARLQHPCDHIGGASYPEELINCRCVLIAAE